jgi:hypothetical protein
VVILRRAQGELRGKKGYNSPLITPYKGGRRGGEILMDNGTMILGGRVGIDNYGGRITIIRKFLESSKFYLQCFKSL